MSEQDPAAAFRIEAADLLDGIEQAPLDLAIQLDDRDLVDTVFRGLHTLKGSGAMFGFDALAAFTHHCETAFDRVRKGQAQASAELVHVILSAMDHMRALVDGDAPEAASDAILARLHAALPADGAPAARSPGISDTAPGHRAPEIAGWRLAFRLPPDAMANGTNPLALLDELRGLGACRVRALASDLPALDGLNPQHCLIRWEVELDGAIPREAIEDVFIFVMDDMEMQLEPVTPSVPDTVNAPSSLPPPAVPEPVTQKVETAARAVPRAGESVRVPAERLDVLMDRVGELVIVQSRLSQLANSPFSVTAGNAIVLRSIAEEIERLVSEMRDTMMVLRMVPIATLFGRFRRLIHDLARETGKDIELVTEGEATEVDKTVAEQLADPIVHLIRNACDHGLETAAERVAAGKAPAGRVTLTAAHAGGEVLITITDDGRGIDRDRVRVKAEANGLVQPGQALSDADLLHMIFHPGFSTAAQVTSLSGRGVGMDVVKRTIEGLRGTIDIASVAGAGSTFTLRIPLTLAIIEGLLVRVGTGRYVIPLTAVEECLELTAHDDDRSRGRSMIRLRDALVPFLRLRDLFGSTSAPDDHQKIVVIATGGERVGLVVDQIIGSHQTVIKSMSAVHRPVTSFSGATILGDGSVALILDIMHLVALGQHREARLRAVG